MHIRKLRIPFLALILFSLSSCFDIVEEFTIHEDGTGEYAMKMDMSKMMDMITSMGKNAPDKAMKEIGESKDTTIYMKDVLDENKELTAEQKEILKNGTLLMRMNAEAKEMFFKFNYPFKDESDLQKLYQCSDQAMKSANISNLIKKEGEDKKKSKKDNSENIMPGLGNNNPAGNILASNQYCKLSVTKSSFEKIVDKEKMKAGFDADSSLKMMLPMLGGTYVTTIVHLPRPAKNVENPLAELSADRMTVTIKYPFSDYTERPGLLNLKINY
jgi:hypothetical protein